MSLEQRILNIDLEKAYYCGKELRAIALEVRKREDRIKQLEEEIMEVKNKHSVLVADVVLNEDRAERIKQLEEMNNQLCDTNVNVSQERDDLNVRVKKLEEENGAMRADLLLWKYQLEEERGKK